MKVTGLAGYPTQSLPAICSGLIIHEMSLRYYYIWYYKIEWNCKNTDYDPKHQKVKAAFVTFI